MQEEKPMIVLTDEEWQGICDQWEEDFSVYTYLESELKKDKK